MMPHATQTSASARPPCVLSLSPVGPYSVGFESVDTLPLLKKKTPLPRAALR
jgi:hypothetical protein